MRSKLTTATCNKYKIFCYEQIDIELKHWRYKEVPSLTWIY